VQAVAGEQPPGAQAGGCDGVGVLRNVRNTDRRDVNSDVARPVGERPVQGCPSHPQPWPGAEPMIGDRSVSDVPDTGERKPVDVCSQSIERGERARHEPLAAGLVDRAGPRLAYDHRETGEPGLDGGRQSDRPAAGHNHVRIDHCGHRRFPA
jgi:hypothetical protein